MFVDGFDPCFPFRAHPAWVWRIPTVAFASFGEAEDWPRLNAEQVYHKMFPCCRGATAITGKRKNGANRARTSASPKNFSTRTGWVRPAEKTMTGVHNLKLNRQVYLVEGASAPLQEDSRWPCFHLSAVRGWVRTVCPLEASLLDPFKS
jgi:hypothetical protein